MVPLDVLPRILRAQLEEARQLVARRQELRQRREEATMRGRVEAAYFVALTLDGLGIQTARCLRGSRDLAEFIRHWYAGEPVEEGRCTPLQPWIRLADAMGLLGARNGINEVLAESRSRSGFSTHSHSIWALYKDQRDALEGTWQHVWRDRYA